MTRAAFALVVLFPVLFLAAETQAQDPTPLTSIIEEWDPKIGSISSIIELRGYRLHTDAPKQTKVVFVQRGVEVPAQSSGSSGHGDDVTNNPQTLRVIVPEGVVDGLAQIFIDVNGHRSNPASILIGDWKPPEIKRVTPTVAAPGTLVAIDCTGFHVGDELEITDLDGRPVHFHGGGSSAGTAFGIPEDAPEGVWTIRIGNRRYGKGQSTEPVTINITNDPLPLELTGNYLRPVAPGQWLDLQSINSGPLKHSQRTEVLFEQAGRTIVVATEKSWRPHVEVPGVLKPGQVQIQARTWRNGRPSEWSQPVNLKLLENPLAPSVDSIRLDKGQWTHLAPGQRRPTIFNVSPGDYIVLHGLWPVADATKLKVSLLRAGEAVELSVSEFNYQPDWFGEVKVRFPRSLEPGEWRMVVSSESDGTSEELQIVIRVVSGTN